MSIVLLLPSLNMKYEVRNDLFCYQCIEIELHVSLAHVWHLGVLGSGRRALSVKCLRVHPHRSQTQF